MTWVIYLFGSGAAFFLGIGLILAGLGFFAYFQGGLGRAFASLLAVVGMLLVALSSTPLPYWFYAIAGMATVVWLFAERRTQGWLLARRNWLRAVVVALSSAAVALELPYHFSSMIVAEGHPTFYIIGDSVSAGMGGEKETWPRILARTRPVEVVDLAQAGATAASALRQAESLPQEGGLVLLEIGGNDVLGSTSAAKFERDLGRLLDRVCLPGRAVLMFELPLPPFCNEYGRSQRRLAAEHGVTLVPKRVFASVLTGDEATLDSIHLDRAGHERMAEVVWSLIQPAFAK
jgi:acyl-CoA thioesterase-1